MLSVFLYHFVFIRTNIGRGEQRSPIGETSHGCNSVQLCPFLIRLSSFSLLT
nr:MAG TPA: hypothetical protein [Caudoviricetes sp.]